MKIIIAIVIAAALGIGGYVITNKKEAMLPKDTTMVKDASTTKDADTTMMKDTTADASRYIEYSKVTFDNAAKNKRVLFFYANWCPTCIPADASFEENKQRIPKDVTLIRVNYNDPETDKDEKKLAEQYNITYQHTFVQIDPDGNEVATWNGGQIDELLATIK